ncbi:hypothetical protein LCGC14_0545960 [marine sediment metagenome]|uniref:Uncharacterized protein n=1 Tax=marine sediment metagenome TaxID=412755 RepID=A0A0F9UCR5_9ZZZZ
MSANAVQDYIESQERRFKSITRLTYAILFLIFAVAISIIN